MNHINNEYDKFMESIKPTSIDILTAEAEDRAMKQAEEAERVKLAEEAARVEAERVKSAEEAAHVEAERVKSAEEAARVEAERVKSAEEAERVKVAKTAFDIMISAASAAAMATKKQAFVYAETAAVKAEEESRVTAETERIKAQQAETERIKAQQAETERIKAQQAETERIKAQQAETERIKAQQAETERIKAQQEDAERIKAQQEDAERIKAQQTEQATRVETERIKAELEAAERIKTENITRSTATSAAIAAAIVAIEDATKHMISTTPIKPTVINANIDKKINETDRIIAIASAYVADKYSPITPADTGTATEAKSYVAATTPSDTGTVTEAKTYVAATTHSDTGTVYETETAAAPAAASVAGPVVVNVPTDMTTIPADPTRTKHINGLLVLIAHILKQKGAQAIMKEPTIIPLIEKPPTTPKPIPPTTVDVVKYNKAVMDFKTTITTKYPYVDINTLSISPVSIEKDATNIDKYILFASFDVNGVNKTEYNNQ